MFTVLTMFTGISDEGVPKLGKVFREDFAPVVKKTGRISGNASSSRNYS